MTPIKSIPPLSPAESSRQWYRRLIPPGGFVPLVLVLGAIATHAWISSRLTPNPAPQGLTLRRQPGPRALASRCSDCPQPGDVVTARVAPGSNVYVFYREVIWFSCSTCSAASFTLPELGQVDVVGVEAPTAGCLVTGSLDLDLLRLRECSGHVSTARINIR